VQACSPEGAAKTATEMTLEGNYPDVALEALSMTMQLPACKASSPHVTPYAPRERKLSGCQGATIADGWCITPRINWPCCLLPHELRVPELLQAYLPPEVRLHCIPAADYRTLFSGEVARSITRRASVSSAPFSVQQIKSWRPPTIANVIGEGRHRTTH